MGNKDYYKILGVKKNASDEDIRKAYLKLARKHHPDLDRGNREAAEARMKEINEANDVLSDREKRREYDGMLVAEEYARSAAEEERARRAEEAERAREWAAFKGKATAFGWAAFDTAGKMVSGFIKILCGCAVLLLVIAGLVAWAIYHYGIKRHLDGGSSQISTYYEESAEQRAKRYDAELRDIEAKIRSLTETAMRQEGELESAATADEKRRMLDTMIATLESALNLIERATAIIQNNLREGILTESDCREFFEALRYAEPVLKSKIAHIKQQISDL